MDKDGACSFPDKWLHSPSSIPDDDHQNNVESESESENESESDKNYIEYRSLDAKQLRVGVAGDESNDEELSKAELYVGNYTNPVFPLLKLKLEDSILKVSQRLESFLFIITISIALAHRYWSNFTSLFPFAIK